MYGKESLVTSNMTQGHAQDDQHSRHWRAVRVPIEEDVSVDAPNPEEKVCQLVKEIPKPVDPPFSGNSVEAGVIVATEEAAVIRNP
uniref:Uncharacterized protein n=1 Tax=Panagrellus redivivus TaxID=6233 RepID=A0A7E4VZK4_PANRE